MKKEFLYAFSELSKEFRVMHHDLIKTPIKNYNIIFLEVILGVFLFQNSLS